MLQRTAGVDVDGVEEREGKTIIKEDLGRHRERSDEEGGRRKRRRRETACLGA